MYFTVQKYAKPWWKKMFFSKTDTNCGSIWTHHMAIKFIQKTCPNLLCQSLVKILTLHINNTSELSSMLLACVITYIDYQCHCCNTANTYHGTLINIIHWLLKNGSLKDNKNVKIKLKNLNQWYWKLRKIIHTHTHTHTHCRPQLNPLMPQYQPSNIQMLSNGLRVNI